jgi:RHS repeat-associated protein
MVFAMHVTRNLSLVAAANPATANTSLASLRYLHHDHLGSVAAVTSDTGTVIERLAFDPWGKRRNVNGQADVTDSLVGQTTDRGYTEHEHLDEMGLIHMNGRVYDPLVGRMMSADPFIQAPGSLQSYNRYSYVMNNPLNLTDPSGYFSLRGFLKNPFASFNNHGDRVGGAILGGLFGPKGYHAVFNFLQGSGGYQLKSAVLTAASGFCYAWAAACNAGAQAGLTRAYGGSDGDALRAGAIAGVSTGAFQLAGMVTPGDSSSYARYLAHAGAGCVSAAAGGGNCGRGAVAGVFGKFASNELSIGGSGMQYDIANGFIAATAGGIGSVIAGGKFENGAVTAAYGYLFNQMQQGGSGKQPMMGYEYPSDVEHPFGPTAEFKNRFIGSKDEFNVYIRTQEIASGVAESREWLRYDDLKIQLPRSGGPLYQIYDMGTDKAGALRIAYSPKFPNVFYISLDHYTPTTAQPNRWTRFTAGPPK